MATPDPHTVSVDVQSDVRKITFLNAEPSENEGSRVKRMPSEMRGTSVVKTEAKFHVIARIPTRVELKTLTHMAKRPAINIDFRDIEYTVSNPLGAKGNDSKTILHNISGSFRSGELTAILGSSGAGKSTLMNILAGYVTIGVSGTIETNGHPRQLSHFNKLTSYIMQDDLLQPFLTVRESMMFASNLKLGNELNEEDKEKVVEEILNTLCLSQAENTRTERLSGGQRKRLSVALELVNNPPVIFLDEPTTGLDMVSTSQLMEMLKLLARQGRTIVCTVHQPTATIFETMDLVYVMAAGQCMYQGPHDKLVPFLAQSGLECPTTYNPADYVMEVISPEEKQNHSTLCAMVQNGRIRLEGEPKNRPGRGSNVTKLARKETVAVMPKVFSEAGNDQITMDFPTTFLEQTKILLKRRFIQQTRNKVALSIMVVHHILSALLIGSIFIGVGNDGNRPFDNVRFIMSVVVFYMYTHVMCNVLLFPFELKRLRREYFNRWYGLKSFYFAQSCSNIPSHIVLGFIFAAIVYFLTDQPIEATRILWFYTVGVLVGITSEGLGMTVGAIFKVQNGCVAGPVSVVPMLAVAVYGMGFGTSIEPIMQVLMYTSYLRFGIVGLGTAVYGEREKMRCDDTYCHYQDPAKLLTDLGMYGEQPYVQALCLCGCIVFFRTTAYLALRYKLSLQFSTKVYTYLTKVLGKR